MKPHPDRPTFANRVGTRMAEISSKFEGTVFRFVKPQFSSVEDMFAGKGALYANGRWLLKGKTPVVYTSSLPETALAEALASNRYYGFPDASSAPLVFVTAAVKLENLIDLFDGAIRQRLKISRQKMIDTDWRSENRTGEESLTQAWGGTIAEAGIEGFLCPSSTDSTATNLLLFRENFSANSSLNILSKVDWPR